MGAAGLAAAAVVTAAAASPAAEVEIPAGAVQAGAGKSKPPMKAKEFLSQLDHDKIVAAIGKAEQKTSGEIRVFISRHKPEDAIAAAQAQFAHLEMHQTTEKNGVLIFVAPGARKFAIIGDSGVHSRCGDAFWRDVAAEMTGRFKKGEFTSGILHGIEKAGDLLARHFPHKPDDKNELPDDIAHD